MPWFKVDDALAFSMKAINAGNSALGLWVRAGSWSMQQLTDGFVPGSMVPALGGTEADAEALVTARLWHPADGGFRFHDWSDYQPTKEQVLAERAAATERKRVSREKSRQKSQGESRRDARGIDAVIPASPTRPDPTRPPSTTPDGAVEGSREVALSPFCPKHQPNGPDGKSCRACGDARMALEVSRAATRAKPTPLPTRDPECETHPGYPLPCDRCAREAAEVAS
ncbi:MAG: hypothetical protein J0H96_05810 [Microbacterium ginsengisoli]|nr:hypothetical protein [Microbacterium ginsengisoli]